MDRLNNGAPAANRLAGGRGAQSGSAAGLKNGAPAGRQAGRGRRGVAGDGATGRTLVYVGTVARRRQVHGCAGRGNWAS